MRHDHQLGPYEFSLHYMSGLGIPSDPKDQGPYFRRMGKLWTMRKHPWALCYFDQPPGVPRRMPDVLNPQKPEKEVSELPRTADGAYNAWRDKFIKKRGKKGAPLTWEALPETTRALWIAWKEKENAKRDKSRTEGPKRTPESLCGEVA